MNKAVFLDRDGVVNHAIVREGKPFSPKNVSELKLVRGCYDLLYSLKRKGYLIFVVTNQPEVARGNVSKADVDEINDFIMNSLPVDEIFVCYHDDNDLCRCRKPLPGLIFQASQQYDIDLTCSYMIGDRWRDMEAGVNAGCITIYIDYGYSEKRPSCYDFCVGGLRDAVDMIS